MCCFRLYPLLLAVAVSLATSGLLAGQFIVPAPYGGYTVAPVTSSYGSCRLEAHFQPVQHRGQDHLERLLAHLTAYAGPYPANYTLDLIEDLRGVREINALTCAGSNAIWLSVTAYEELASSDVSLAFILAHELHHGRDPQLLKFPYHRVDAAGRQFYYSLSPAQKEEVNIDIAAADLLVRAGYEPNEIIAGLHYILRQDGAVNLLPATDSHPGGQDRVTLLTTYLRAKYASGRRLVQVGRVLPR